VKQTSSPRERMLGAINNERCNYIPFSFMLFTALADVCKDRFGFIERQLESGADAHIELPELPVSFNPEVKFKQWIEKSKDGEFVHKEYQTSCGNLSTVIRMTEDWPYGDFVPLLSDYNVSRSRKFIIEKKEDLEPFRRLLSPPTDDDIASLREQTRAFKKYASKKDLLITAGMFVPKTGSPTFGRTMGAVGGDALLWLCGVEKAAYMAMDEPETLQELLDIIHQWNIKRTEILLDQGIDLLIRRAWYESTDLWSPSLCRKLFFGVLQKEIKLVHEAGAKYGYIMTSGMMPLLDDLLELGIDVLIGVDPMMGRGTDLEILKEKLGGKICLWGGINGPLTIEKGTEKEVEDAVEKSISILGPDGFILSPVDNLTDISDRTWSNIRTMTKAWKRKVAQLSL